MLADAQLESQLLGARFRTKAGGRLACDGKHCLDKVG
jgi:hypothetical protein